MTYQIIYADPPWAYLWGTGKEGRHFAPEKHYETMPIEDICDIDVKDLRDKNCALFYGQQCLLCRKSSRVLCWNDIMILQKSRADRNRTMTLSADERKRYRSRLLTANLPVHFLNRTICSNLFEVLPKLPMGCCDLIFADPPYNLTKEFNGKKFKGTSSEQYVDYLRSWLPEMKRLLKPTGSIYVCGDWRSAAAIQTVLEENFIIQNRITWEREKGRGAKLNWKNNSEDIWFATVSNNFTFHVDRVMMKRKIIAPYTDTKGKPKGWNETDDGRFRLTYPSNLWTDISVPFWSMPENTEHPTQKPEKLLAKIILASSESDDIVFDPFLGSGTTSVVAKKLGRQFFGIEIDEEYCCLAEKRLEIADKTTNIQGYSDGVFWERNTLAEQSKKRTDYLQAALQNSFFE